MIIGYILTNNAIENFNKENYKNTRASSSCDNKNGCLTLLILAVVILVIEISLLYYAISVAVAVSKSPELMFINVMLAIVITLPYLLLNILFNPAAKAALGDSSSLKFSCGMF